MATSASTPRSIDAAELPAVITRYLHAHTNHDADAALGCCAEDSVVIDEGQTYRGHDDIHRWLNRAGSEYSYTTTLLGASRTDATHYTAVQRLEGDFPGNLVDLRYVFTLEDGLIGRLHIAP